MKIIRAYFESNYFILVTYIITLTAWWFNYSTYAMIYYVLMGACIILCNAKRINIATVLIAGIIIPRSSIHTDNAIIFIILTAFILPFMMYDLFKHKLKMKNEILIAMLLLLVANVLSLVNTNSETIMLGLIGVGQIALFAIIFLYFYNHHDKHSFVVVGKNAFAASLTIAAQMALYIIFYEGEFIGKDIDFGWAISNGIAMMVTILIPLNIALYVYNQKYSIVLLGVVADIIIIIFTLSKGAYATVAIIAIPLAIISFVFAKKKLKLVFDFTLLLLILGGVMYGLSQIEKITIGIIQYLANMEARGWLNDESRIQLLKIGLEVFLENPIFGQGSYTKPPETSSYLYHNFIFQTAATTGVVGVLAFGYYIFAMVKKSCKAHIYSLMVFIMIVAATLHGLVDNAWYNPIIMVIIAIATAVLLKQDDIDEIALKDWLNQS